MKFIDRSIAIIRPKKPFVKWANSCEFEGREFSPEYFADFHDKAIIIPYFDSITVNKAKKYVTGMWKELFTDALNGWISDQNSWPKDMSAETFNKWFKIEFIRTVINSTGKL